MPGDIALNETRLRFAAAILHSAAVENRRVRDAFATIPREAFLMPPPWTVFPPGGFGLEETSDPADLYADVLVVLDERRGVNNGQPSLHAAWLTAVDPRPGDTAIHIGAGTGYYTAILALLVLPGGRVHAYEIDPHLAGPAAAHLSVFDHVVVEARSGLGAAFPAADVVYVNAGVTAPDAAWLAALKPGGRLIFPWQPFGPGGVAVRVRREPRGFSAEPLMAVGFIACEGGAARCTGERPGHEAVERTRSVWLAAARAPDDTATAVYDEVWFSAEPVSGT